MRSEWIGLVDSGDEDWGDPSGFGTWVGGIGFESVVIGTAS